MAKNYIQPGNVIDHAHTAPITSGTPLQIGKRLGVALADYAANEKGEYAVDEVYEIPAASASVFAAGDPVYWDVADGEVNVDSVNNDPGGYAFEACADGDVLCAVKLNG